MRHAVSILLVFLLGCFTPAAAGGSVPAAGSRDTLRVVMDDAFPPYIFRAPDGTLKGILVDQWTLWEQRTGIRVRLDAMTWAEAQRRMEAGEYDVIDTIFENEHRRSLYSFTRPYAQLEVPLFLSKDLSGIRGPGDLAGFVVGAKRGGNVIGILKAQGLTNILLFDNYEAMIGAARDGRLKVFTVEKPPALYYLIKMGIQDQFRATEPLYTGEFRRAVRKGDLALLAQVQSGFDAISPREYAAIEKRWYGAPLISRKELTTVAIVAAGSGGFLGLMLLWVWTLRRVVRMRTRELGESEGRNLALIRAIPDLIITFSRQGVYLAVQAWDPGLLIMPAEQLLNRNLADILPRPVADQYTQAIGRALDCRAVQELNYSLTIAGGEKLFEARMAPCEGDRVIAIVRDVTEHRRLLLELQHAEKMESIGSLAGGVAHDMNNVLAAIMGMASVLEVGNPDREAMGKALGTITRACARGRDVVKSLLYFARKNLEATGPVNLNAIAGEVVHLLSYTTLKRLEISTGFQEPLGLIEGDAGALSHALINLCVNAVDAMPEGGALEIRTRARGGWGVEISIKDSGNGMSPEVLRRAAEPFFTTKPVGKGTGLGLAMVYGTVRAHKGTFEIRSQEGLGTEVILGFPRLAGPAGEGAAEASGPGDRARGPLRILLVDDDELVRLSVAPMLTAIGHEVQTAESGLEALERVQAGLDADLVILDMNMPGLNGAQTLARVLALRPGLVVLMATGYSDESVAPLLKDYPNVHSLRKPFSLNEIRVKLAAIAPARKRLGSLA